MMGERRHLSDLVTVSWVDDGHPALGGVLRVGQNRFAAAVVDLVADRGDVLSTHVQVQPEGVGANRDERPRPTLVCRV